MGKQLEGVDRNAKLAALDASMTRGLADADAGRTKPASEVFDRLEATKYAAMVNKRRPERSYS